MSREMGSQAAPGQPMGEVRASARGRATETCFRKERPRSQGQDGRKGQPGVSQGGSQSPEWLLCGLCLLPRYCDCPHSLVIHRELKSFGGSRAAAIVSPFSKLRCWSDFQGDGGAGKTTTGVRCSESRRQQPGAGDCVCACARFCADEPSPLRAARRNEAPSLCCSQVRE